MSGGCSVQARRAFADSLTESLYGPDLEAIKPFKTLDQGVAGYAFDLIPLRQSLEAEERKKAGLSSEGLLAPTTHSGAGANQEPVGEGYPLLPQHTESVVPLLQASLSKLPPTKIRLVNSTEGPHEVLKHIKEVGIDVFDSHWAQKAADYGVGLDFEFPLKANATTTKKDIGRNLYDTRYALDFGTVSDAFRGAKATNQVDDRPVCPCPTCSPLWSERDEQIYHGVDTIQHSLEPIGETSQESRQRPHYTRAYIHHLLHTHEMSAHTFLVMHNLAILDAFFKGIREVLDQCEAASSFEKFDLEVRKFAEFYDGSFGVFEQARRSWREVDLARGKGRLAREKGKEVEADVPV